MAPTRPRPYARKSSIVPHYQTFPTAPPRSKGRPPSPSPARSDEPPARPDSKRSDHGHNRASPLPVRQLAVLAFVCLCEQTALNSISPYLPQMASTFPEVDAGDVGVYVGTIASVFAAAQFATNFFWGWLSDRVGRKPVILLGTLLTAACLFAFGFCRTLWQAIVVQGIMGLINGNQGVVSTCLGEITDRSNQSRAFAYLPVLYGLGAITGPLLGGLAAGSLFPEYPYLAPNLLAAAILLLDLLVLMLFMEESLEEAQALAPLGKRLARLVVRAWRSASPSRYIYSRQQKAYDTCGPVMDEDATSIIETEERDAPRSTSALLMPSANAPSPTKGVFGRETILILFTYFIFQLSNVSYNSLYPIFGSTPAPTGRDLSTEEIGLSLAFAGLIAILFQVGLFNSLHERLGNRVTYRVSLALFAVTFFATPFVGYKDASANDSGSSSSAKVWLWVELGSVLLVKTVASVGGLTSVLLLITNSAPNHAILGALNGLAQTLSAAGRAVGPFLSGGLFSLATTVKSKGEALVFGIFGGIAFVGFLTSFGIRSLELEADGDESDSSRCDEGHESNENGDEETLVGG